MESLKDKVTIITGGGSGFGRCTALLFAKYGAPVVLADLNLTGAEAVAAECINAGLSQDQVLPVKCDITKDEDRTNLIQECVRKFGRIDVLVNNAGIYRKISLLDITPDMYDFMMNVNLKSQIFLTQLAVPYLKKTKGCIVNLSSVVAEEAVPHAGVYCLTKAGVASINKLLALGDIMTGATCGAGDAHSSGTPDLAFGFCEELAEFGIRVNSVRPGTIHTGLYDVDFGDNVANVMKSGIPQHPLGRLGDPEEVAKAIAFLASDLSSYSTGNFFFVDGGRHCVGAKYNPYVKT